MNRRNFMQRCAGSASALLFAPLVKAHDAPSAYVELAHREIWRRFIDPHGIMLDFADQEGQVSLPTPRECNLGIPNALGWGTPIENGAMFNGLYMEAMTLRWKRSQSSADAHKARRLANGLLFLASQSRVEGFVARGVSTDGTSHYPMGSEDQTLPWFYGLWRYLESGLASVDEQNNIRAKLVAVAESIVALDWKIPAEPPFNTRGTFAPIRFISAPRQLFVAKLMAKITNTDKWESIYQQGLAEFQEPRGPTRLSLCEQGLSSESPGKAYWTSSCAVAALRGLWELETRDTVRNAYERGLARSAQSAAKGLHRSRHFDSLKLAHCEDDWREMSRTWKEQITAKEAASLASAQIKTFGQNHCPRRVQELSYVREPLFAAWIVSLCPSRLIVDRYRSLIEETLMHFPYDQLHFSQFFPAEAAWYRIESSSA